MAFCPNSDAARQTTIRNRFIGPTPFRTGGNFGATQFMTQLTVRQGSPGEVWRKLHTDPRKIPKQSLSAFGFNRIALGREMLRHRNRFRGKDAFLRLFGITKAGLLAMTLSVSALWSCIVLEKITLRRAGRDAQACLKQLQDLRERALPASEPVPLFQRQPPKVI